jgi:hypothetical protein
MHLQIDVLFDSSFVFEWIVTKLTTECNNFRSSIFFRGLLELNGRSPLCPVTLWHGSGDQEMEKMFGIATAVGRAYVDGEMAVELEEM